MGNVEGIDAFVFGQAEELANVMDHGVHEIADGIELHESID